MRNEKKFKFYFIWDFRWINFEVYMFIGRNLKKKLKDQKIPEKTDATSHPHNQTLSHNFRSISSSWKWE